jgi:hypothetical protein
MTSDAAFVEDVLDIAIDDYRVISPGGDRKKTIYCDAQRREEPPNNHECPTN